MSQRALAEVNLAAIERNVAALRSRLSSDTRLCAVVKANAYGHGSVPVSRTVLAAGARHLAVATALEAQALRAGAVAAPILILGAVSDDELPIALAAEAELVIWELETAQKLIAVARTEQRPIGVHVKLDSGLGRLGTRSLDDAAALVELVIDAPELRLVGVMTHFATSDGDPDFVAEQLRAFKPLVQRVRGLPGGGEVIAHAANSGAILRFPETHFDMVRAGISLYGSDPMNDDPAGWELEPALTLRSYVAAVKAAVPGQSAGYSRRFIADRETVIATVPIGYADGLPRALTNNCEVLIGGRRYPLVGTVSMDNITVEVGPDAPVRVGDRVTLIGTDGNETQTAEQLAARVPTISYELLCWISARVPRSYHRDGVNCDEVSA